MSNNNISDKNNSDDNNNLEQLIAKESLLVKFDLFKSVSKEELRVISEKTKLINFEIGAALSQIQYIPSNILRFFGQLLNRKIFVSKF